MSSTRLHTKDLLEKALDHYYSSEFIIEDPISVPHRFSLRQDIEISAFFSAIFSWGSRKIIVNKSRELMLLFDNAPFDFIVHHCERDLKKLINFKHRTFNTTDLLYFVTFLKNHYSTHLSLEDAFLRSPDGLESKLVAFQSYFFGLPYAPMRTRKHISSPMNKSTCKRLNMFLRWMVRPCNRGIDFGIWNNLSPAELFVPLDLHVERTARKLGLLTRKTLDWNSVLELTNNLRKFDPEDPVKYDFALFGLSHAKDLSL